MPTYNGLADPNLLHFFMKRLTKKDLKKNGIIDKHGNMVPSFELQKQRYVDKQKPTKQLLEARSHKYFNNQSEIHNEYNEVKQN